MSITFYFTPYDTLPNWDSYYLELLLQSFIHLGPFHTAFGQIPEDATLSVTILPDDDTPEISRLLELYQQKVLTLPKPPKSAYDLNMGAKIRQWEQMYSSSEEAIIPRVKALISKLHKEGGSSCLARDRQLRKECADLGMFVPALPLDSAEQQVTAKMALACRLKAGVSRAAWEWKACRSAHKLGTGLYPFRWITGLIDECNTGWHNLHLFDSATTDQEYREQIRSNSESSQRVLDTASADSGGLQQTTSHQKRSSGTLLHRRPAASTTTSSNSHYHELAAN